ncbi:MAG TPA: hypothetical protein VNX28_03365 [Gemmataceae bacterium]|nr:hypothetical protein [Gemmataceae bacterium]
MRRIFFGTSTLVLGLATLLWTTAPISGGKGGHSGGGHAGGGHAAAPAHVGSVHYAAPSAPVRVAPAVRTGTVQSEHYAGSTSGGAYRNPYRDEYFRHFRPGYRPYFLGGAQYYGYDDLPVGFQTVVIDGITYYLYDGVYYQAYLYGGQTVYLVTPDQ